MKRIQAIQSHLVPSQTSAGPGAADRQIQSHTEAAEQPERFWSQAANDIAWIKQPTKILDASNPPFYRWFVGGLLNTCYNAVDRHVEAGHGSRVAIYYDSPLAKTAEKITYQQLKDRVARLAGVLKNHGVSKGDTVVVYMPMVPETMIAMLACARIGAIHSVVFGGFAAKELAKRIEDCQPKMVLSASCGIEPKGVIPYKPLLDEAISLSAAKPRTCIILQRPMCQATLIEGRDFDWTSEFAKATPQPCVPVEATHPLYILYTSGTTGKPKGVMRDHGGYCVALKWAMSNIFSTQPGEVYWAASDFGWVVGHSFIVYAPLLQGSSTVVYEGKPVGTPDPGAFWRVIQQYSVSSLFTAPTVLRTLKKEDPTASYIAKYPMPSLRALFLAGERCDPDSLKWAMAQLMVPVIDNWWMTETGWPITAQCLGLNSSVKSKPGAAGRPVPGFQVMILDDNGKEVPPNAFGNIVIKLPMPPGTLPTLWKNDERYQSSYLSRFPGYFDTGDAGYKDLDRFIYVMSRTDDLINVAGHRLSTGSIEEVLAAHPMIAEVAVIGALDTMKGEKPLGFIVLKAGISAAAGPKIVKETIENVRRDVGPFASYERAYIVERLPKTRSGKILRRTLRSIVNKEKYDIPATIEDPVVLKEIEAAVASGAYLPNK